MAHCRQDIWNIYTTVPIHSFNHVRRRCTDVPQLYFYVKALKTVGASEDSIVSCSKHSTGLKHCRRFQAFWKLAIFNHSTTIFVCSDVLLNFGIVLSCVILTLSPLNCFKYTCRPLKEVAAELRVSVCLLTTEMTSWYPPGLSSFQNNKLEWMKSKTSLVWINQPNL